MSNQESNKQTFLVVQIIMARQEIKLGQTNQFWDTIIRQINANNIEEAVGKFMINTQDIFAVQRLNPIAYELSRIPFL